MSLPPSYVDFHICCLRTSISNVDSSFFNIQDKMNKGILVNSNFF